MDKNSIGRREARTQTKVFAKAGLDGRTIGSCTQLNFSSGLDE